MTSVRPGRAGSLVLRRAALTAGLPGPGAVAQDGGDNRAEHAELDRDVGDVHRAAAGPEVDPVHYRAAPQAGIAEDPVGQVARRAAEHGRDAERERAAAGPQRE